jgi:hypothetical protein
LRRRPGACTVFATVPLLDARDQTPGRAAFEGHLAYDFMNIAQIERFYSRSFRLNPGRSGTHGRLGLPAGHRNGHVEGQRSRVLTAVRPGNPTCFF